MISNINATFVLNLIAADIFFFESAKVYPKPLGGVKYPSS